LSDEADFEAATTLDSLRRLLKATESLLEVRTAEVQHWRDTATLHAAARDVWQAACGKATQQVRDLTAARDAWQETARHAMRWATEPVTVLHDATLPGPALVAETRAAIMGTPRPDSETPRSKAAESAIDLSGEKPNTGHPAGGRALSNYECGVCGFDENLTPGDHWCPMCTEARGLDMMMRCNGFRLRPGESFAMDDDGSDAHEPAPPTEIDIVVDALGKRLVPQPDRARLGRALDAANAPPAPEDRAAQDAAVQRAFRGIAGP
jgi:rubrerythrin